MKGFPNQIADLSKLSKGVDALARLLSEGLDARDDSIFGEALVRVHVAGTGHQPQPVEEYLAAQRRKTRQNQSYRTTARGLRELYRSMALIEDSGESIAITAHGLEAASFADRSMDSTQIEFWRRVIRNMRHQGGDSEFSHPYQVLLRLIARRPEIPKRMCALALEARNDSDEELNRIVELSRESEEYVIGQVGVTQQTWMNAIKVLPKFAEQLGDVEIGGTRQERWYRIASAPGAGSLSSPDLGVDTSPRGRGGLIREPRGDAVRQRRTPRQVSARTIGRAGTAEHFDDVAIPPPNLDAEAAARAIQTRLDRLRRHNMVVRELATRLTGSNPGILYEDPMDMLLVSDEYAILGEVKTLDGSEADERDRVRDALGQLLYYEAFVAPELVENKSIYKVACFESRIAERHQQFLNSSQIGTIWRSDGGFAWDHLTAELIGDVLGRLSA